MYHVRSPSWAPDHVYLRLQYTCVTLALHLRYACIALALRLHYTCVTLAVHLRYACSRLADFSRTKQLTRGSSGIWPSIYFLAIFKNILALYYQANFMDISLLLFFLPTHIYRVFLLLRFLNDVIILQISVTSLFSNFFLLPPFCL